MATGTTWTRGTMARLWAEPARAFRACIVCTLSGLVVSSCDDGLSGPEPEPLHKVAVSVETNGVNPDRDGYSLEVDGGAQTLLLSPNDSDDLQLTAGRHAIELKGIAQNCGLNAGLNPFFYLTVPSSTALQEGAEPSLELKVTCMGDGVVAFSSGAPPDARIHAFRGVGVPTEILVYRGVDPEWSRDGSRLAFTNPCASSSSLYGPTIEICEFTAVATANREGNQSVRVTFNGFRDPSWSPDGNELVFEYAGDLYLGASDRLNFGTRLIPLPAEIYMARDPSWSPTGDRIAFACSLGPTSDICTSKVDGSDYRNLTNDPGVDGKPAWSPDGSLIAFHTSTTQSLQPVIVIMAADGSSRTELGEGREPAWSPDGLQIVYDGVTRTSAGQIRGLHVENVDGSGRFWLGVAGAAPSWGP